MPENETDESQHEVRHRADVAPDTGGGQQGHGRHQAPSADDPAEPAAAPAEPADDSCEAAAEGVGDPAEPDSEDADPPPDVADTGSAAQPESDDQAPEAVATLAAQGIGVRSQHGWIFRDIDLRARAGELVAIAGPAGSGRTTLLLALGGRLRVHGALQVLGEDTSRARASRSVLRRAVVARAADVISLDPQLSVARNARDAADWARRPVVAAWDLLDSWRDRTGLPLQADRPAEDLGPLERLVLELALAQVAAPEIVLVDDLDAGLTTKERCRAWELVQEVASSGPTVVATALDPPAAADHVIQLGDHVSQRLAAAEPSQPQPEEVDV